MTIFAADMPAPHTEDSVMMMTHALKTQQERARYGQRQCTCRWGLHPCLVCD